MRLGQGGCGYAKRTWDALTWQGWADLDMVGLGEEERLGLTLVGRDRQDGIDLD